LWYTHFTAGIVLAEKTGILPKATLLGAAITLIANVILLPILGLNGAAIATLMSYMSMSLYMLYETERVYPINYPWISAFIQVFVVALLIINTVYIFVEMSLGLTLVLGLASVGIPLSTMFIQSKKYN
jgi:O-antigen/teichoic acid export membrane protein